MNSVKQFFSKLEEKPPLQGKWLFLALVLLILPQFVIGYQLLSETIMTDLHSRILGSRLLSLQQSPYFFQWNSTDPLQLYDPNIALPYNLNGVTATPFFLWLQEPLSKLNYCNIKLVWYCIEELLLLVTVFFTCLYPTTFLKQLITIIISIVFFVYSRNWSLHNYAGQYYIVFAAIFALTAWYSKKKSKSVFYSFPTAALLRPFFALALIPFLLKNIPQKLRALISGGIISLVLFFISGTYKILSEYNKAMNYYSQQIFGFTGYVAPATTEIPTTFEACVYKQSTFNNFNAGCLFSVQHYLNLFGFKVESTLYFSVALLVFITLFIFFTAYKRITLNVENTLIASFLIYILCELFTPAFRNPYNLIQYAGILGLVIKKSNYKVWFLLILGLALNHDFPVRLVYQRELGEILMLLSIYLTLFQKTNEKKVDLSASVIR